MTDRTSLATQFEANRGQLLAVAYRMLGSRSEAEDAVQEAWLRLSRVDTATIANTAGWLRTTLARICLDMLRARSSRSEQSIEDQPLRGNAERSDALDPEEEALMAESVGLAMAVVVQRLAPLERVAFVLHDMFDLPFEEIAAIVDRSPAAARQLASRARRRVRGVPPVTELDIERQRVLIDAYLAAARGGDFEGLLRVLDPNVALHADRFAAGGSANGVELRGAETVARGAIVNAAKGRGARMALIDGVAVGFVAEQEGRIAFAFIPTIDAGRIVDIEVIGDQERLAGMEVRFLD